SKEMGGLRDKYRRAPVSFRRSIADGRLRTARYGPVRFQSGIRVSGRARTTEQGPLPRVSWVSNRRQLHAERRRQARYVLFRIPKDRAAVRGLLYRREKPGPAGIIRC